MSILQTIGTWYGEGSKGMAMGSAWKEMDRRVDCLLAPEKGYTCTQFL